MELNLDLDLEIDKIKAGFLAAGILIGIVGTVAFTGTGSGGQTASQNLVSFLENQSGQELEVMETEKAGTFYRVSIRNPENQVGTYYTSSDGNMYTQSMQNVDDIRERSTALAEFSSCLEDSGTTMYGNASQQATQLQIQRMGGAAVVQPIYKDVTNQTVLQEAVQRGVQRVPGFHRNESVIQGVQPLQQVEQFTGCQYQLN
jgi:hypothetical protein